MTNNIEGLIREERMYKADIGNWDQGTFLRNIEL